MSYKNNLPLLKNYLSWSKPTLFTFTLIKRKLSPFSNICSDALTLFLRALLILSSASVCINILRAAWRAFKCFANTSLLVDPLMLADCHSLNLVGLDFLQKQVGGYCTHSTFGVNFRPYLPAKAMSGSVFYHIQPPVWSASYL